MLSNAPGTKDGRQVAVQSSISSAEVSGLDCSRRAREEHRTLDQIASPAQNETESSTTGGGGGSRDAHQIQQKRQGDTPIYNETKREL